MVKPVGIIVQAHMGSTRLKEKMLRDLYGKSVLGRVLERLKKVKNAQQLIVATSDLQIDDILAEECGKYGVSVYRGSDHDVLARFYHAARQFQLSHVARVCADNTLIDWKIISEEIRLYQQEPCDVMTTGKTVPLGLGCEIFSMESLTEAYQKATESYQHEHVTPYIYEHVERVIRYEIPHNYGKYRFTLDTEKDWELITKIYKELYQEKPDFLLSDVIDLMSLHPDWLNINKDVHQKTMYE